MNPLATPHPAPPPNLAPTGDLEIQVAGVDDLAWFTQQLADQHYLGAGRRDIAEIVRFATKLSQKQRRLLGLPRQKTTRAFYKVPTYTVFYQVLTRLNADAFATLVHDWLQARAGTLPAALAL